jgi:hypothetical protein
VSLVAGEAGNENAIRYHQEAVVLLLL